jgi:hypothetical protein
MSLNFTLQNISRIANTDLSGARYLFLKQTNTGSVTTCSVAGESALGVAVSKANSGTAIGVAVGGCPEVLAGASIVPGDQIATNANGQGVPATQGQAILGEALSSAANGETFTLKLAPKVASGIVYSVQQNTTVSTTISISSSELLALHATPKTLLSAPDAGFAYVLESAIVFLDYGTIGYAGIAGGEDLSIQYASGDTLATCETTGFLDSTSDAVRFLRPSLAVTPKNADVTISLLSGEITTGDSVLKIKLYYSIIPLSL